MDEALQSQPVIETTYGNVEGMAERLGRRPFCAYRPRGGASSSAWLHEADWLDMNMIQSGHVLFDMPNLDKPEPNRFFATNYTNAH